MYIDEELATEVQRLGDLLISRSVEPWAMARMRAKLSEFNDHLETAPELTKTEMFGGNNRVQAYLETGEWPPAPPEGQSMVFDPVSFVGGANNPFSLGTVFVREGHEAVGRVRVGRVFEGPPQRVHGGAICAIFDEVFGSVFRATSTPSAFTGELAVRFVAPAPISAELEFRARQVGAEGRKRFLEGEALGPDGRFATATATFIEMRPEHFATSVL